MKKLLSILLAAVLVCAVGVGCGCDCGGEQQGGQSSQGGQGEQQGGQSSQGGQGEQQGGQGEQGGTDEEIAVEFDTSKPVTIRFYHSMAASLRNILDNYVKEFNKLYPNITVEHRYCGGDSDLRTQIDYEILGGTQPNIATCRPDDVALYDAADAVQTLDGFLPDGKYADMDVSRADGTSEKLGLTQEDVDLYNPNYFNEGYEFGDGSTLYTLPWSKSTEVLFYNVDYFNAKGYTVPTSWDELEQLCIKIKADEGGNNIYPFTYDSEENWFITMCEQQGSGYTSATGEKFLFDNEQNRAFVKRFAEWYGKGYFTTEVLNGTYTSDLFQERSSYMYIVSTESARFLTAPFKVGIAQIPQVNPDKPKVISEGLSVCIFKSDDPQETLASWLFVKYLTTNVNFQAEYSSMSGYMPVLNMETMMTNSAYMDYLNAADGVDELQALAVKFGMEHSDSYFVPPAFVGSSDARTQVGALMTRVFRNPEELDAAFNEALEECKYYA